MRTLTLTGAAMLAAALLTGCGGEHITDISSRYLYTLQHVE
jgi:hypothetical protein